MKSATGIALFAMVAFAAARPHPPSQPKALADQSTPTADIQKDIDNFTKQIHEGQNIPESILNYIKTLSTTLVNDINSYITQVSEDIKSKSPEVKRVWEDMKGKLSKVVVGFTAQFSDVSEQAAQLGSLPTTPENTEAMSEYFQQLVNKFNQGPSVLVDESEKAVQAISQYSPEAQEDVAKFTKEAVDIATRATVNFIVGLLSPISGAGKAA